MAGRSAGTLVTSRACLRAAAAVRTVREPARGDGTGGACGILRGPGGGEVLLNARLLRALRASPVGQPASHRWRAPRPNVSHNFSCSTCCPLPRSSPSLSASVSASHPPFRHGTQTPPPPFIRSQERAASGKCCDGPTRGMPREGSGASGFKKKKKRYAGPCAVRGEDHRTQAVE